MNKIFLSLHFYFSLMFNIFCARGSRVPGQLENFQCRKIQLEDFQCNSQKSVKKCKNVTWPEAMITFCTLFYLCALKNAIMTSVGDPHQ